LLGRPAISRKCRHRLLVWPIFTERCTANRRA